MDINQAWSLLSRRVQEDSGRRVTVGKFQEDVRGEFLHTLLVPAPDAVFSARCTEQLIQAVLESSLRGSLLEQDPLNTYAYPVLYMSDNSYSVSNPSSLTVTILNENYGPAEWGKRNFSIKILSSLMRAEISSPGLPTTIESFTITDRLSSKIELYDKLFLRLFGTLPSGDFMLSAVYNQKFNRSLSDILSDVSNVTIPWKEESLASLYRNTHSPVEKTAALTMNIYGMLRDAN